MKTPASETRVEDKLSDAMLKSAETLGCTPGKLLLWRLTEMQRRIIEALGEVSYEQFYNPEPQGFILMRLPDRGFDITVDFCPRLGPPAIHYERLIPLADLEQRKERLLATILSINPSLGKEAAEHRLLEQLKAGEFHWNGRKKANLALEILSAESTAFRALSFQEEDSEQGLTPFAENPAKLQQLTRQVLGILCEPGRASQLNSFLNSLCRPKSPLPSASA
jgi:hypothetical protein